MDKNDKKLDDVSNMEATPVNSSMSVRSPNFEIFSEVKTMRQKPSRLDDVFNMWEDLLFAILNCEMQFL